MRTEQQYTKLICNTPISDLNCKNAIPDAPMQSLIDALEHSIRMTEKGKYTKVAAELRRRYREGDDPEAAAEIPKFEDAKRTPINTYEQLVDAVTGSSRIEGMRAITSANLEDLTKLAEEHDLEAIDEATNSNYEETASNRIKVLTKSVMTKSDNTSSADLAAPAADFPLSKIASDAIKDLQQRAGGIDDGHIDEIKSAIEEGVAIAAIDLYLDEETGTAYISDGWHRYIAHHLLGKKSIKANVYDGGKEAAFEASLSANAKQHAKPRRRGDIRKAVTAALGKFYFENLQCKKLPKSKRKTMAQIAALCVTTEATVSRIAKALEEAATKTDSTTQQKNNSTAAAGGTQIDFWETFRDEANEVISGFRARIADADQLKRFEAEPERTAEEFEALADTLQHEATEIRKKATAIRTGLNKK